MRHDLYPNPEQATMMDLHATAWHRRMDGLMTQGTRIITLRGAGTVHGIEPVAAHAATEMLGSYVAQLTNEGTSVALLFDGDADNPAWPDVGSVFGGLADSLRGNFLVSTFAAQKQGWYQPASEGAALRSASGTPYETYIFPDTLPGEHAALTQSPSLVAYGAYEQWFVGSAGPLALAQLQDLNNKAAYRPAHQGALRVTVLDAPQHARASERLMSQLALNTDEAARAALHAKLAQRDAHPHGALFSPAGAFLADGAAYPHIAFDVHVLPTA